ncbi:GNAT family N-acetyltransferase [Mammaliicoccus stepanovicii]|uniref:GNAT family acetyltransferase n=1 Tax=Mammaliicoccus stepanovicii TaxID=643214 RepID=A0A240A344_9STAP|nr:GNAT family N-acetyltransferase [Mammaliicoccus stepanovicii]PNZ71951.1 GNAT family N-acetyltransferase [Mammaliicoccus stepanovicii]GGI39383.1 N-acetyltransferase [Mammaliicoccus stepanovicii]SNV77560.1 GNAT family acetyltransferase [Mammaliicoccus stepanovicii]
MYDLRFIQDDSTIYAVSQMAAKSIKSENQNKKLIISLEYEAIKRSLAYETSILIGAFDQDECVAFIWGKFDIKDKEVKIYNLYVEEKYRRQRIATSLKDSLEKWAEQLGARSIVTTVDVHNKNMMHINESRDYEIEKIIMRKSLNK